LADALLHEDFILAGVKTIHDEDTMEGEAGEQVPVLPSELYMLD
jgi:hypothetical protein